MSAPLCACVKRFLGVWCPNPNLSLHVECCAAYRGGLSCLDPISGEPGLWVGVEEVGDGCLHESRLGRREADAVQMAWDPRAGWSVEWSFGHTMRAIGGC